ncbi:class I SAM-dependent methyltransferase [Dinoroseobacter sp. S76]|uniref:class I SAM-dependent methyltransferase n=1 Tax=Dinoroseobacter sp. S76 TaxID=3415124 RepID=UPI003C7DA2D5
MTQHTSIALPTEDSPLVQFWNDTLAPKFQRYRHILVGGLSRHSAAVMPGLGVRPGDRILDVGCGFGDTAIDLAQRVLPGGEVLGIDCCDAFIAEAWHAAEQSWTENARFARCDAELGLGNGLYDLVFARFGTMFFANPVRGLTAMRQALKPGGRVVHIVWRDRADNPWLDAPARLVREYLPAPGPDAASCGPGPFSMADPATTRAQMEAAGFTDITFERVDEKVLVGRDIAEAIDFQFALGPAGETIREAGPLAERQRPAIEAALAALFRTAETTAEGIWMDSSSWVIRARAPGA